VKTNEKNQNGESTPTPPRRIPPRGNSEYIPEWDIFLPYENFMEDVDGWVKTTTGGNKQKRSKNGIIFPNIYNSVILVEKRTKEELNKYFREARKKLYAK